ncbi:hypothetical protein [Mycobacterium heckeshornense]|nr:hypothetical protein [Mycobacterium heckeshornense]
MTTAIVVTLTLVALGIVIDRLLWLRKWLNKPPPGSSNDDRRA